MRANVASSAPRCGPVVQKANLHELEKLVDLAADLGFSNQVFSLELTDFGLVRWHEINAAASAEQNLDIDVLLGLVERGKERDVRVRFWNTTSKYSTGSPEALCPWPFERAYISSDQRVVPCCFIGNPDVAEIGASPRALRRSGSVRISKLSARHISTATSAPIAAVVIGSAATRAGSSCSKFALRRRSKISRPRPCVVFLCRRDSAIAEIRLPIWTTEPRRSNARATRAVYCHRGTLLMSMRFGSCR
jgi:hypothetical protein